LYDGTVRRLSEYNEAKSMLINIPHLISFFRSRFLRHPRVATLLFSLIPTLVFAGTSDSSLTLNKLGYFEKRGFNVLVFSNFYDGNFSDAKISSIEIIQQGVRTATNGDVRLSPTPGQWDPVPQLIARRVLHETKAIEVDLAYPDFHFKYTIRVQEQNAGVQITVNLDTPLPLGLEGKAGLNLEFLPSAYFGKAYFADGAPGIFPLYPTGPTEISSDGTIQPKPIAIGKKFVLAPEDQSRRVAIDGEDCSLSLFDGRNTAQNGWYVVRSLIPSGKSGKVIEWFLTGSSAPNWIRTPVIEHSQVGYAPSQKKVAVIELDKNDTPLTTARLLRVAEDGSIVKTFKSAVNDWGKYLRYNYLTFDFSSVKESGLYVIEYDGIRTKPFRIGENVYADAWHPTLDVYLPVQMDHMLVREAYRVWHGLSDMDDALQAPVNHEHFDLYAQGPTTDSPYKPGEHIPGLNVGGWFDAGDYDIRTQTQYAVVSSLVETWEMFHPTRDETTVDERRHYVEIHRPDGVPDIIEQIQHGVLQLLAQQRAVGHAINGIIEAHLSQYHHLGDASTRTDNLIYNPRLDSLQSDGFSSGTFDDRWAFTSKSTPLNYGAAAALAAASRALHGYNDTLAEACLSTAEKIWTEEHTHKPDLFSHGNTTGGDLESEELHAAVELLITTQEPQYSERINGLWSAIEKGFIFNAVPAVRALPYMDAHYREKLRNLAMTYDKSLGRFDTENPFGVPISTRGWAGSGFVVGFAITNYFLHRAFPDIIDSEYVFRGLDYIYGCHPGSDISFVSGVGTVSKKIAYGSNRADFTFIAGGVVPGELILKPDFPENKEDWPFLWGENEYVVALGSSYIFLVNAANDLLKKEPEVINR